MLVVNEAKHIDGGIVDPEHTIEVICAECGYDVDESELEADTCSDCGATLSLQQNVAIKVTTLPSVFGDTM